MGGQGASVCEGAKWSVGAFRIDVEGVEGEAGSLTCPCTVGGIVGEVRSRSRVGSLRRTDEFFDVGGTDSLAVWRWSRDGLS